MRKGIVAAIALLSLLALCIAAILVLHLVFGFRLFDRSSGSVGIIGGADGPTSVFIHQQSGERDLLFDETFPADGVTNVDLSLGSDEVDIFESSDGSFRVVQYGRNLKADRVIRAQVSDGTLEVSRNERSISFQIGIINNESWVELYVPAGYGENMNLNLSSGSMRLNNDLGLKELNVKVSSGAFRTVSSITADDVGIEVLSGDVKLGAVEAGSFDIGVSSGRAGIESLTGSGALEIMSGKLVLDSLAIADSVAMKVSSGNLSCTLAGDPSLEFTGKESSGELRTYFEKYYSDNHTHDSFATVGDGPYKTLSAEVLSGTLRIGGETAKQSVASVPGGLSDQDGGGWETAEQQRELESEMAEQQSDLEEQQRELASEIADDMAEQKEALEEQRRELEEQARELEEQARELEEQLRGNN